LFDAEEMKYRRKSSYPMTFANWRRLVAGPEFFLLWTLSFCRPSYVHQLDFDGAGRQGRKQGVAEVEFDT